MRHTTFIEVHLGLLEENFFQVQNLAPKAQILPMIKADAYGHGVSPVASFLEKDCGVKILGCASLGEALRLRQETPSLTSEILVFSDTELQNEKARQAYLDLNITPVLHHRTNLEVMSKDLKLQKLPLVIKLNTGMNRLGLSEKDILDFLPLFKQRGIQHLMTHFARSSQLHAPGDKTSKQLEEFFRIKKILQSESVEIKSTSVANSGAIEQGIGVDETFVRPGLMLYGPPSVTSPVLWKGHQISRFVTKVLTTFMAKKGTPIGYGVNVADRDSFFALLPIGYGDGILTFYSGSKISINGVEGKIFGRVNMDMTFIQFDPSAEKKIKINDGVEVWGHDPQTITDLAAQNKTIPYQLMCAISGRIPRIYKVK